MLGLIFATLFSLASAADDSLIQTLVFGSESSNEHFCDCNFSPHRTLTSVTIFKVIDQNQDQAVPCARVYAIPSPNSNGYFRIELPANLVKKNVQYSFQFEFADGPNAFSETWEYDAKKQQFIPISSINQVWYEDQKVQVGLALGGMAALIGGGSYLYRRNKKSRSLYVQ